MVKEIFYTIMTDQEQREEFSYLADNSEDVYEFFCQKGYRDDFETFREDMQEFLESAEARKIISNFGDFELSEDMLDMVAGGQNVRKILNDGMSKLSGIFSK